MLESAITPALGLMLFATFLQVPLAELKSAFANTRFLTTLLISNFLLAPLLVALLLQFAPSDPLVRLGLLLVLLTPCIDYVITFAHLGRADSRLLLAYTPVLLIVQMLLLPLYLRLLLGDTSQQLLHIAPFISAFAWLILLPLLLAYLVQRWAARSATGKAIRINLDLLPVPATAFVLFIVVAAVVPQLATVKHAALHIIPLYAAYTIAAPLVGWIAARVSGLEAKAGRAIAFSTGTRNSLVILPVALAVPGAIPILPAVIVTQTLVELMASILYIRLIPKLKTKSRTG